jgi:hypothetical protein
MRPHTLVLAFALATPLAVLAQNPMQRPAPPAETPKIGPSPTSGSDAGPFPPLRDNGVVLNPVVAPPSPPVVQVVAPALSDEDNALLASLRRERVTREERDMDRAEREAERNARRLAQQPPPIVKPWPYN